MDDLMAEVEDLVSRWIQAADQRRAELTRLARWIEEQNERPKLSASSDTIELERGAEWDELSGTAVVYYALRGRLVLTYSGVRVATEVWPADRPDGETLQPLDECPDAWVELLLSEGCHTGLLRDFVKVLSGDLSREAQRPPVSRTLEPPRPEVVETAQRLGFGRIVNDWREAQKSVLSDPRKAVALSTSLIESACKHVLGELGVDYSGVDTRKNALSGLLKEVSGALGFSGGEPALNIMGSVSGLVNRLGFARNTKSLSHGAGPDEPDPTTQEALMCLTCAGSVAVFIMRSYEESARG